jgi:hypothetical protein
MQNIKKLSKEEMKLITASGTVGGGSSNGGNTNCGTEPDPVDEPTIHEYWRACMESNGTPVICPPGDSATNS